MARGFRPSWGLRRIPGVLPLQPTLVVVVVLAIRLRGQRSEVGSVVASTPD